MTISVLIKKIKHKAYIYLRKPFSYRTAKKILTLIINEKGKNDVVFVNRPPIGDTVYGMSALDAYREKYPDKRIIVIGSEKNARLINSYTNIDEIKLYSSNSDIYRKLQILSGFRGLCARGAKNGVYMTLPIPKRSGNIDAIRQQRLSVFHLDENAPITYHGFTAGKVSSINDFESIKDKIVVINPYSQTMPYVTMPLYKNICDILISRGYKVYTNVVGDQVPVEGSEPLYCDISELYSIACKIPLIVSVRSGILDLLVKSNINMFVLYEGVTKSRCYDIYRLGAWKCKANIEEIFVSDNETLRQVPDMFLNFLARLGM